MSEVKWIKIVTDVFDDEKILLIESMPDKYAIIVCWFKLLCLAGKQNNHGVFLMNNRIAYTDEMLATIFRMPLNSVRMALDTFQQFNMIEIIDGVITIQNWEKHQSLDKLERAKEKTRLRVAAHRERQKQLLENDECCNVTVTLCNADRIDKEEDIEREEEKIYVDIPQAERPTNRKKSFTPPSIEEVRTYCLDRQNNVDPERFIDYYTANGWHVGKNKMKDWKAAVRTWEKKEVNRNGVSETREDNTGNPQTGRYGTWL